MLRKNVASQVVTFGLVNATTGAALSGATVTVVVALDGTQSAGAGTVTSLGTGQYKYVPTQAETNGNSVGFGFTATNAVPVNLQCFTTAADPTSATDFGLSKLTSLTFTGANKVDASVRDWIGGAIPAVNVTGVPLIDLKYTLGTLSPATAGAVRADAVTGAVGSVTGAVGSVTGAVGSVASGGITDASFAAGTGKKVIRANTAAAGAGSTITLDAAASATDSIYNGCLIYLTGGTGAGQVRTITGYVGGTQVATVDRAWQTNPDNTSTFAILPADGAKVDSSLQVIAVSVTGAVGSVTGLTASDVAAIKTKTDSLTFTVANQVDSNVLDWKSATAPAMTGDAFARLGAPAGASVSVDVAAVKTDTAAIKAKTDNLPEGIKKNTALANFEVFMADSTDHVTGKTGLTVAGAVSIDGAAFGALTNTPATEVASGIYKINLAAADLNGTVCTLKFTATGADATLITIKTCL